MYIGIEKSSQTVPNVGFVTVMRVEYWPNRCFCNFQAYAYSVFRSVLKVVLLLISRNCRAFRD